MNTGFLSNPAPDPGYDAVMAALAPHSAPAEGRLGGTTPSVHNRVKQTFVNPVATYPFIAARWKEGYEQSFHPGDLMFIWKGERQSTKTVVLANLPLLNHIMKSREDVMQKFQVKENWVYIGVMRNSAVASGRPTTLGRPTGGVRMPAERIINIDVRGATRMFNYWEEACANCHLYLAWYNVSVDGRMRTEGFPVKRKREVDGMNEAEDPRHYCWQLLPVSRPVGVDPDEHMEVFWNEKMHLTNAFHRAIRVGYVFQEVGRGERSNEPIAIRMATQLAESRFKLPLIHSFLRV